MRNLHAPNRRAGESGCFSIPFRSEALAPFPLSDREALAGRSMITMTGADRWSASFQAQKLRVHSCTTHQAQQLGKSAFAGGSADGCRT